MVTGVSNIDGVVGVSCQTGWDPINGDDDIRLCETHGDGPHTPHCEEDD